MLQTQPVNLIRFYYGLTAVFLLLDLIFDINLRITFLEPFPVMRFAYYGVCFACLAAMLWKPAWTLAISVFESLFSVVALTISFGTRVIRMSVDVLEGSAGPVSMPEVVNFLMAGFIGYFAWVRGMDQIRRNS